ncbi:MAG: alkaline ceramidase [Verrucomicrobiales bacterium]|nr:alkaline ceramidase [Verrucomicrobiales bacterium]|tara:strand:- start:3658 stop:5031 length:1374 start_codon:yes stop_codon:yes gene_type:complete
MAAEFSHPSFRGRIGVARVDITPPIGIYARNWGAAKHDIANSIHRPLTLTAMVLSSAQDEGPLVIVDADLGWWKSPETARRFRSMILEEFALPEPNLIVALSHTHSGPPLMEPDDDLPGSDLLQTWKSDLDKKTIKAIRKAMDSQIECVLDWHTGRCGLATVRDLSDPNPDNDQIICGFNPDEQADDTLLLGRVTDTEGKIRATLVNYACHPTTLAWDNTAISPDYVGAMRDTIQQATEAPALFLLGACGELSPRHQYVGDTEVADRHGRQLAHAALGTLSDMEPSGTSLQFSETVESGAPLAVWKHEVRELKTRLEARSVPVELPLKNWPSAEELEQQRAECNDRALEERLRRKRDIRRSLGDGRNFELSIHAWRIGDAILIGSCCEPYSILQCELRERFADLTVICMNLINGSIGYLPPRELYDRDIYQVWQTPFDRGSLERTIERMCETIETLI